MTNQLLDLGLLALSEDPDRVATFKPSQVHLGVPPLCACFGKTEAECAAALLVWASQQFGDEWQRLPLKKIGEMLDVALKSDPVPEPIRWWATNPFFRPDFDLLTTDGFIKRSVVDDEKGYILTPSFFARIERWVELP
jgi:hypothetical protein